MDQAIGMRRARGSMRRRVVALVGVAAVVGLGLLTPSGAAAATPGPFNPDTATVFIGYNGPTTLASVDQSSAGFSLSTIKTSTTTYNALGYDTQDNYLYAIDADDSGPDGSFHDHLLQIDSTGSATDLGLVTDLPATTTPNSYNQGTFGLGSDAGVYYVRSITPQNELWAIDVATKTATKITLSQDVPNVSDIVYRDGYIWAYNGYTDQNFYRIDPSNGSVSVFDGSGLNLPVQPYGGQWLYGNGNLGLTGNDNGKVYQIAISGADTTSPTFTLVAEGQGQATTNNDAASILGQPVDMAITKTGPAVFTPGESYTYTLTVTNNGPGNSSGSIVKDTLPAGLENPKPDNGGTVTNGVATWLLGPLADGKSTTLTVTGTAASDATAQTMSNTASVTGNEEDPTAGNNTATFGPHPPTPALSLSKTADVSKVTAAGQKITFSFVVTNTGNVNVSDIGIKEGTFTGHGTMGPVVCPDQTTPLAPEDSLTCTADYTTMSTDLTGDPIENTAAATGRGPDGVEVVSDDATVSIPTVVPTPTTTTTKQLAYTGTDVGYLVALAALLLAGGAAALVLGRRRAS